MAPTWRPQHINSIHSLDDNGVLVEGTDDLLNHATAYYKVFFGPAPANMFSVSQSLWNDNGTLNEDDNVDLTRPFTIEEVKNALFSVDSNRAPGQDDIPKKFYQYCWEVVKYDVMNLFYTFHNCSFFFEK
jgi:hypothetical protein